MRILYSLFLLSCVMTLTQGQTPDYFEKNYLDARQKSSVDNKLSIIVFYHDRSKSSAFNMQLVFNNPEVKSIILKNYHIAAANEADFDGKILMKRCELTRIPSLALMDHDGKLIAGANYGMTANKLIEFLQFYSSPANYNKTADYRDDSWASAVDSWNGYKGPDDADKDQPDQPAMTAKDNNAPATTPATTTPAAKTEPAKPAQVQETKVVEVEKPATKASEQKIETPQPKTTAASATTTNHVPEKTYKYVVQAGIFSVHPSATSLVEKINAVGGKAFIEEIDQAEKTLYKVFAGRYYTEKEARDFIAKLAESGINSFIKPIN